MFTPCAEHRIYNLLCLVIDSAAVYSGRTHERHPPTHISLSRADLPVFYYGGLSLGVGARATFRFFERRYTILAEEVITLQIITSE